MVDVKKWKAQLEDARRSKDVFFGGGHMESPIPFLERGSFRGLRYYPPDPDYRYGLKLHEHRVKETVKVKDTKGMQRELIRWGEFRFEVNENPCTLQAYKSDPDDDRLFVPFRDATSGKQTYGAGRYLDLEPDENMKSDGSWIVDFNSAYNPWCAYSEAYACPFVPPENWMKVPVLAGEKDYPRKKNERG